MSSGATAPPAPPHMIYIYGHHTHHTTTCHRLAIVSVRLTAFFAAEMHECSTGTCYRHRIVDVFTSGYAGMMRAAIMPPKLMAMLRLNFLANCLPCLHEPLKI
mmetsp:Transcript_20219/g.38044  ORF Transcript_20219/g.38044 Transcript_20219/m.38044 type:complete len:103 (-) Transcript_20219:1448-1756(-)